MRKRVYGAWAEPDLSHAGWQDAADGDADMRRPLSRDGKPVGDDLGVKRRSFIPDPLTLLIAAESGRPILEPIFPLNAYTPQSPCPHDGPIPDGSPRYCPQCHDTGLRNHRALARDPAEDPTPEPAETPPAVVAGATKPEADPEPTKLTRKQRRTLKYRGPDARPESAAG